VALAAPVALSNLLASDRRSRPHGSRAAILLIAHAPQSRQLVGDTDISRTAPPTALARQDRRDRDSRLRSHGFAELAGVLAGFAFAAMGAAGMAGVLGLNTRDAIYESHDPACERKGEQY
jgi:hypothetical protein